MFTPGPEKLGVMALGRGKPAPLPCLHRGLWECGEEGWFASASVGPCPSGPGWEPANGWDRWMGGWMDTQVGRQAEKLKTNKCKFVCVWRPRQMMDGWVTRRENHQQISINKRSCGGVREDGRTDRRWLGGGQIKAWTMDMRMGG